MAYTKGPWRMDGSSVTSDALHEMDCIVDHVHTGEDDAHLIAAAPELLEALEAALEWIDAVPKGAPLPAMPGFDRDEVNAAIAKARGEG